MALEGRVRAKAAIPTLGASGMDDILMLMADVGLESKARRVRPFELLARGKCLLVELFEPRPK